MFLLRSLRVLSSVPALWSRVCFWPRPSTVWEVLQQGESTSCPSVESPAARRGEDQARDTFTVTP